MMNKMAVIVLLIGSLQVGHAHASTAGLVNKANKHFESKEYDAALTMYNKALNQDPESSIINYNAGTSLYKAGRFNDSIQHLQKALLTDDAPLKQKASYNLGNALYKAGIAKEKTDSGFAVLSLEKALGHYEEAIKLDSTDDDAKMNYEFVKREIERIKMQQTQQQDEQSSPQDQQQKQQQNPQQDQQQQQQQDQDNSSSQQQESQSNGDSEDKQEPQEDQQQQQQDAEGESNKQEESNNQDGSPETDDQAQQEENKEQPEGSNENNENEERESSDEENQQGDSGNQEPTDYNNQMTQGTQGKDEGELTNQEAQMLLRGFEQSEQPQKLLNVFKGSMDSSPVEKDW